MEDKDRVSRSDLLKRKFEPISDWRPAKSEPSIVSGIRSVLSDALEEAQKVKETLEKVLEPFSEDAKKKIKNAASILEETASKSSGEARSFLAKTLEALAEKIKP